MATWSWKIFTIWKYLDILLSLRNRWLRNWDEKIKQFEKLNILVMTNRIPWLNQFRDDLVSWRDGKPSVISQKHLSNMHVATYHSKEDN